LLILKEQGLFSLILYLKIFLPKLSFLYFFKIEKVKKKNEFMAEKKINPNDNQANQQNPNKGTDGTNRQYDQNQGNRGKQLNPNQKNNENGQNTDSNQKSKK
jgi:hypothetical protein